MIKLECNKCHYSFEVSEKEFEEHPEMYSNCFITCGGNNEITNIDNVAISIIEAQVKFYVNKWFNELGIEGTIELIERSNQYKIKEYYLKELRKRGVIK